MIVVWGNGSVKHSNVWVLEPQVLFGTALSSGGPVGRCLAM